MINWSILIISVLGGLVFSYGTSHLFTVLLKKFASKDEIILIESVEAIEHILSKYKKGGQMGAEDVNSLWSEGMNFVMKGHSERKIRKYIDLISQIVDIGDIFRRHSNNILKERFK